MIALYGQLDLSEFLLGHICLPVKTWMVKWKCNVEMCHRMIHGTCIS